MGSLARSLRLVMTCLTMCLILTSSLAVSAFAAEVAPAGPAPAAPALTTPPAGTSPADVVPDPSAWQNVITGQIEAFRHGDAPTAFGFAAAPFQTAFPDAVTFMESIAASGYTPIFTSVSHSFGKFTKLDDQTVMQIVNLVGAKQELFDAVYQLTKEPGGWRVVGVQLMKSNGIAV
jgi:hypothetical protein